jgi:RHH-type proline utilization regulon transcriptional repressor/proline dehydrogenase/delta 1-pyrroline-5-carboxylate dehydrogenase
MAATPTQEAHTMSHTLAPSPTLEDRTQVIGRALLAAWRERSRSGLWSDRLVAGALADEHFKTELFRFIDVFPVLKTPAQVHDHLTQYARQPGVRLPTGMTAALTTSGLLKGTLAHAIAHQIESMARHFIVGRDAADALPVLHARWKEGIAFSVDLLGEACVSQAEAQAYLARYLGLISQLPRQTAAWSPQPLLERDHLPGPAGIVPRANVSLKISALDGHLSPVDTLGTLDRLTAAITPLLELAAKNNVLLNFDMEQHALKELTIRLFKRCCERFAFPAGLSLQTYLRTADEDVRDLVAWARANGRLITLRLIKGAYWDYETIHARLMNWPTPVWDQKKQTDACYERISSYLIENMPRDPDRGGVKLALGTHNLRSVAHALAALETAGLPSNALEFQSLRGMGDELKTALTAGIVVAPSSFPTRWRVREYMPIGEMIPGMAYLVRRLLENTSNNGWVRAGHNPDISDEELLAPPPPLPPAHKIPRPPLDVFQNEPLRDFSREPVRQAFHAALAAAKVTAVFIDATPASAGQAIARAQAAFPAWRRTPPLRRAGIIRAAAAEMRRQRDHLAAEIILESQKTWTEADADVCEAIDFCEFYAAAAERLFLPKPLGHFVGEDNTQIHEPRGTAAVIAPWNFPLSIPTGMTVAALVTGNPVILKPAEQTPAIARRLCTLLWQAGIPDDVLQYLPGPGETIGNALVRDPRIAIIAFTGSAQTGLDILKTAYARDCSSTQSSVGGGLSPQHFSLPHVICEMGGKNAIIIDASADLDEAVLGVCQSAFSHAGQKCSACSRAIVLESVHDAFVARLAAAAESLIVGNPRDPATDLGPVIDDAAADKIWHYVDLGRAQATLVTPTQMPTGRGRLIPPHIFTGVLPESRLAQEEIFGPVLAVMKTHDFADALRLANAVPYKLTGGVYSRTPAHLAEARHAFQVGNLYLNRPITGALVGRQPFGGFGLSGLGTKAGGEEYLLHFTDSRIVTENTLRRGFAGSD